MLSDLITCCFPCFLNIVPTISINSCSFKIVSVLGEGSYSIVYLVQPTSRRKKGRLYALKKIRTISAAATQKALNEVSYYKQFNSPYIIKAMDSSCIQELDGARSIYVLFPYFRNGTLQDLINCKVFEDPQTGLSENEILRIFVALCRGVLALHSFHSPNEIDNGGAYHDDITGSELFDTIPYAHYDLKPENIFISRDGTPVIGDLGSCLPSRIEISSGAQAISFQELVSDNSTPEYRAPELFNVKVNDSFDESVDIWSLGCTLYAMMYGIDPFTREAQLNGANLKLAILANRWSFPDQADPTLPAPLAVPNYSDKCKQLVKSCLVSDPDNRASIDALLQLALSAVDS